MFHLIDNIWKPPRSMEVESEPDTEVVFRFSWKWKQNWTASTSLYDTFDKAAALLLNYWMDFKTLKNKIIRIEFPIHWAAT